jgi:hypothetical protein
MKATLIQKINEQVKENRVPYQWQVTEICTALGTKVPKPQKRNLTLSELTTAVKNVFYMEVFNAIERMNYIEIKQYIASPSVFKVLDVLKEIKPVVKRDSEAKQKETIQKLLEQMNEEQLWAHLLKVTKFVYSVWWKDEKERREIQKQRAAKKSANGNKGNYISISDNETKQILAEYYTSLASGASVVTPECFRKAGVVNATNNVRRLIFSHYNQDICKSPNSINKDIYTYWKNNNTEDYTVEQAQETEQSYIASNPNFLNDVKAWQSASYISGCLKRDNKTKVEQQPAESNPQNPQVQQEQTEEQLEEFIAELEAEAK